MRTISLFLTVILMGCPYPQPGPNTASDSSSARPTSQDRNSQLGPPTASETSSTRPKLEDRIAFIEQYVTFDRTYLKLEYDVVYHNNSGRVPGPSDWDIKILAVVPANEIDQWVPTKASKADTPPSSWLSTMPDSISTQGVTEWYTRGTTVVGIDRATGTIAYRNTAS